MDPSQNKILIPPLVSYYDYGNTIPENDSEIQLIDVLLKRVELFKLLGDNIDACEDLNKALEID